MTSVMEAPGRPAGGAGLQDQLEADEKAAAAAAEGLVEMLCSKGGAAAPSPGLPSPGLSGIQSVDTPRRAEEARGGPSDCAAAGLLSSSPAPAALPVLAAALLRWLSRRLPPADIIPVPSGSGATEGYLVVRRRNGLPPRLPTQQQPGQGQGPPAPQAAPPPVQAAAAAAWTAEREQRYLQQVQAVRLLVAVRATVLQQEAAQRAAQQAAQQAAMAALAGAGGDSLATSTLLAAVASLAASAALPQQAAPVPASTASASQLPQAAPQPCQPAVDPVEQLLQASQQLEQAVGQQRPPLWRPQPTKRPRLV
ncbi:hypothetical protein ABPG77_008844 [Micractinium sp. CCAP 211/92]